MRVFIAALSIALCGCSPSPMDKAKQDFSCKENGGVYEYTATTGPVMCMDGNVKANWTGVTLTKDFYPKPEVK